MGTGDICLSLRSFVCQVVCVYCNAPLVIDSKDEASYFASALIATVRVGEGSEKKKQVKAVHFAIRHLNHPHHPLTHPHRASLVTLVTWLSVSLSSPR